MMEGDGTEVVEDVYFRCRVVIKIVPDGSGEF